MKNKLTILINIIINGSYSVSYEVFVKYNFTVKVCSVPSACRIKLMFLSQLKLNGHRIFFLHGKPSFLVACHSSTLISNWEAINVRLRWQRQHSCQTMKKTNNQQSCQNLFSFLWRPHTPARASANPVCTCMDVSVL